MERWSASAIYVGAVLEEAASTWKQQDCYRPASLRLLWCFVKQSWGLQPSTPGTRHPCAL